MARALQCHVKAQTHGVLALQPKFARASPQPPFLELGMEALDNAVAVGDRATSQLIQAHLAQVQASSAFKQSTTKSDGVLKTLSIT